MPRVRENFTPGTHTKKDAKMILGLPAILSLQKISLNLLNIGHQVFKTIGNYSVYSYDFSAGSLILGTDYDAVWKINPDTFPNGVILDWYNPKGAVPGGGIWGYHHIDYANYDGSLQQAQITPRQICNLTTFSTNFDWSYTGSSDFNLLHELWITKASHPTQGNSAGALLEVGFFLHNPDFSFFNSATLIGTYTNNGVSWEVRRASNYVMFVRTDRLDQLSGTIDWKAALLFLVSKQVLTGSEWINGVAFGIEPTAASGTGKSIGRIMVNNYTATITGTATADADYLGANIFTGGNDISNPAWNAGSGNVSIVPGQVDFEGGSTAQSFVETTVNDQHGIIQNTPGLPASLVDYLIFADVKNNKGRDWAYFQIFDNGFAEQVNVSFDLVNLATGAIYNSNASVLQGMSSGVIDIGSGWRRIWLRLRKPAIITGLWSRLGAATGNANLYYTGDTTKGLTFRTRLRLVNTTSL